MLDVRLVPVLAAALLLALPAGASDAAAVRIHLDFFTPGYAVMCWEDHHEKEG